MEKEDNRLEILWNGQKISGATFGWGIRKPETDEDLIFILDCLKDILLLRNIDEENGI